MKADELSFLLVTLDNPNSFHFHFISSKNSWNEPVVCGLSSVARILAGGGHGKV